MYYHYNSTDFDGIISISVGCFLFFAICELFNSNQFQIGN